MVRTTSILILILSSVNAFFNIRHLNPMSRYLKLRSPMYMNYLQSIENNSFVNRTRAVLKPKPFYPKDPIPRISFYEMFVLIFNTKHILMSSNADRIIINDNNTKGVYYMPSLLEKSKMEYLLSLTDVDITIVNDYPTKMDSPRGEYYCSPMHNPSLNMSSDDIEDIMNGIIRTNEDCDK